MSYLIDTHILLWWLFDDQKYRQTQLADAKLNFFAPTYLAELYDLIHYFRLGLSQERTQPRTPGLLKGKLGDAFFEPLPEDELQQWE
ncbi:hypothetical protein LC605_13190 [Nostoc sp. CHAB 5836]|uniref:hypothetical protein n=1 Tax=Nostoc sp. CHAB 5836 TaxID=2780404 RepID=UPI001E3CA702|nr:hypothetical protein [Nostoc sp. CHAB 5836]MCC5616007.1 hypothetical protein [Nostoc sp. CHAB 5836]